MKAKKLTAKQWQAKAKSFYRIAEHYRKLAEDLFNGKRDASEAELAKLKESDTQLSALRLTTHDHTYTRGPDGNLYLIHCE